MLKSWPLEAEDRKHSLKLKKKSSGYYLNQIIDSFGGNRTRPEGRQSPGVSTSIATTPSVDCSIMIQIKWFKFSEKWIHMNGLGDHRNRVFFGVYRSAHFGRRWSITVLRRRRLCTQQGGTLLARKLSVRGSEFIFQSFKQSSFRYRPNRSICAIWVQCSRGAGFSL